MVSIGKGCSMDGRSENDTQQKREDQGLGSNPPGASVSREQLERYDMPQEQFGRFSSENTRYDLEFKPDGYVWHIKPLVYTLGLGIPGLLLLLSSMLLHVLIAQYGNPFIGGNGTDYAGLVRLLTMLAGAFMLICAWPIRRPVGWTVEEQQQYEDSKQYVAKSRMRERD